MIRTGNTTCQSSDHSNTTEVKSNTTEVKNMKTTRTIEANSNLYQTQQGWQALIALPHVDIDSIELQTISHKLKLNATTVDQDVNYVRTISFPPSVRWGEINATWHNGLLKIDLLKEEIKPQNITIQVSD